MSDVMREAVLEAVADALETNARRLCDSLDYHLQKPPGTHVDASIERGWLEVTVSFDGGFQFTVTVPRVSRGADVVRDSG